ncbi:MAG: amidohydrolase family protein, partial [Spirochaetaceae bacterium]|nr:amidohydrolase family protein [Spirochaetaceae bacterium]
EEDVAILAGTHTRVSHNPVSNMYLASGVAPIPEMIRAGITVGIATDGPASNNNQNMLSQLKYTALVHKVNTRDPTIITAEKVLELATIGGAKAVGLEGTIGPIEVGKKADIVVVNLENSHAGPVHRPVSSLVYSAIGSEVETVMVNGELLMKDRRLLTLDEEEILANANQAAFSLAKRIGIDRPSGYIWREPT